jgi:hypothetical protein
MANLMWIILIPVAGVVVGLSLIQRYGPGVRHRLVNCPEKKVLAVIDVERKEGSFGALLKPDVAACSLLSGVPVTCDKKCLE